VLREYNAYLAELAEADRANQQRNGLRASYIVNRYINYSNYCILSCQFCAFSKKKRDADGFQLSSAQIVEKAREALALGITELHIVGGLHPSLPFSYYVDFLKALKALDANELEPMAVDETLGVLLKYQDDIAKLKGEEAARLIAEARAG
jgi:aminodeoxyfutalosine synthase